MVGLGDDKFQIQLLQWSLRIMQTGTLPLLKDSFRAMDGQTTLLIGTLAFRWQIRNTNWLTPKQGFRG